LETKTKRTAARPTNPVQNQNSEAPGNLEEPSSFRMKYFTPEVKKFPKDTVRRNNERTKDFIALGA
jgi:hypothetical protein